MQNGEFFHYSGCLKEVRNVMKKLLISVVFLLIFPISAYPYQVEYSHISTFFECRATVAAENHMKHQ